MKTIYGGNGQCGWLSSGTASSTPCALDPAVQCLNSYKISEAQDRLSWKRQLRSSSPGYDRTSPRQPDRGTECRLQPLLKRSQGRRLSTTAPGSPSQHLITPSAKKFLLISKVDTAAHFLFPYCTYYSDTSRLHRAF